MSWAASRTTTREEEEAYSLMGIFDISMPMLYGEGRKAFIRLQEAIVSRSSDQSIFAWEHPSDHENLDTDKWIDDSNETKTHIADNGDLVEVLHTAVLAPSASAFKYSGNFRWYGNHDNVPSAFTLYGFQITLPLVELGEIAIEPWCVATFGAILSCRSHGGWIALNLSKFEGDTYCIHKRRGRRLRYIDSLTASRADLRSITITEISTLFPYSEPIQLVLRLDDTLIEKDRMNIGSLLPPQDWQVFFTSGAPGFRRIRGAHFNPPNEKAQNLVRGAIVFVVVRESYPLKIGLSFYYEFCESSVSDMALRLRYWTLDPGLSFCYCKDTECDHKLMDDLSAKTLAFDATLYTASEDRSNTHVDRMMVYPRPAYNPRIRAGSCSGFEITARLETKWILGRLSISLESRGDTNSRASWDELEWDFERSSSKGSFLLRSYLGRASNPAHQLR